MDRDGNLQVHTKQGQYSQSTDGKVIFQSKDKTDPGSLKKAGPVSPGDYEKYGISTNGKTLRFPNGVEYTPSSGKPSIGPLSGLHIPPDIGSVVSLDVGNQRHPEIIPAKKESIDGKPLVSGHAGQMVVHTEGGNFIVDADGKVSYEPGK
jgi:hypothetical protein